MANIIEKLKHIQPVYRRSSNALKIFFIVIILFCIVGLFVLRGKIVDLQAQNAALEDQAAQFEQDNAELQENIDNLDTVQGVEQVARDELGLVNPDTVVIQTGED